MHVPGIYSTSYDNHMWTAAKRLDELCIGRTVRRICLIEGMDKVHKGTKKLSIVPAINTAQILFLLVDRTIRSSEKPQGDELTGAPGKIQFQ